MVSDTPTFIEPSRKTLDRRPRRLPLRPAGNPESGGEFSRRRHEPEPSANRSNLTGRALRQMLSYEIVPHLSEESGDLGRVVGIGRHKLREIFADRRAIAFERRPFQLLGKL